MCNFTTNDMVLFYDQAPDNIGFNSLKAHFVGPSMFNAAEIKKRISEHLKKYNGMFPEYRIFLSIVYDTIFELDFEEMPLLINSLCPEIQYVAQWRLKVGK